MKVIIFNRLNDSTFDKLTLNEKIEELRKTLVEIIKNLEHPDE